MRVGIGGTGSSRVTPKGLFPHEVWEAWTPRVDKTMAACAVECRPFGLHLKLLGYCFSQRVQVPDIEVLWSQIQLRVWLLEPET